MLESHGYQVIPAEDGKIAKEILSNNTVDLVLSDIQMPQLTGVELLTWIKGNRGHIPVILMTGFSHILQTKQAAELGASGFIPKPFEEEELISVVESCLNKNIDSKIQPNTTSKDSDHCFCRVSIDEFISEKNNECPIYIKSELISLLNLPILPENFHQIKSKS